MFIAFFFILMIYYLQTTSRLDQLEYDVNTISAGDFTVELSINRNMYKEFIDNFYDPIGSKTKEESGDVYSQALYLKKFLTDEVERMLTRALKYRKDRDAPSKLMR